MLDEGLEFQDTFDHNVIFAVDKNGTPHILWWSDDLPSEIVNDFDYICECTIEPPVVGMYKGHLAYEPDYSLNPEYCGDGGYWDFDRYEILYEVK